LSAAEARDGEEESAAGESLAAGVMGGDRIICLVGFRVSRDGRERETSLGLEREREKRDALLTIKK
jgi:hypothetical protein